MVFLLLSTICPFVLWIIHLDDIYCRYFLKNFTLDFDLRVIVSFCSPFSTLQFSLKIKSFTKQNMFYRSDILHDFLISSF